MERIEGLEDVLRPHECEAVDTAGQISQDEWMERVFTGDERA
jgi:uncharacterized protein